MLDNGSSYIRAGFAGDDAPRAVFPTVVGRPKTGELVKGLDTEVRVGDEVIFKRNTHKIETPVEFGIVSNWEDMERVWHHTFDNELRVRSEGVSVMIGFEGLNPGPHQEKMTQIMFEVFNVSSLLLRTSALLSLYAAGRTTGLVISSG